MIKQKLHDKALVLLTNREHSRYELEQRLGKFCDNTELIQQVLTELIEQNLLSDERFSEQYINTRANRGFGSERIAQELKQRGISAELIDHYLNKGDIDWDERLQSTWRKRFKIPPKNYQEQSKQMRFLLYRGFTMEQIVAWMSAQHVDA